MIHRTFRSLDQPPKLVGFTIGQWGALIADVAIVLAAVHGLGLPVRAAVTLLVFTVGLPAALAYVSEAGGIQLHRLLQDLLRWRFSAHVLPASVPGMDARAAGGSAASLLGVAAIQPDGLLVRDDGSHVRYLDVTPVNPLAMEPEEAGRVSAGFAQVAARLEDGQSLQLYVQAVPLELDELLAVQAHRCQQAAGAAKDTGDPEHARAIRALGAAQEHTLRQAAEWVRPLRLRYLAVCPWRPSGRSPLLRSRRAVSAGDHERAASGSLRHTEGIRGDLEAAGVTARLLTGREVLDLVSARFDPERHGGGGLPASFHEPRLCPSVRDGQSR